MALEHIGDVMARGGRGEGRTTASRKGKDKQPQALQPKIVGARVDELVKLKRAADEAAENFAEGIKKAAEDAGFQASVVRRFVVARAGNNYKDKRRDSEQLELLFDEVKG